MFMSISRFIFHLIVSLNHKILYDLYYLYFADHCGLDDCTVFTFGTSLKLIVPNSTVDARADFISVRGAVV